MLGVSSSNLEVKCGNQVSVLEQIFVELKEIKNWFLLGVYLGISDAQLKIIEQNNDYEDTESCKLDMLITWTNGIVLCIIISFTL